MGNYKIQPRRLSGEVSIPPSKSMAHRAVICAALAKGKSVIENIDFSDDIIATIDGMEAFGAKITRKHRCIEIDGIFREENMQHKDKIKVDCNESGSTLRFLVPISLLFNKETNFIGRGNLGKRPLEIFYNIFDKQDIQYSYKENELDLKIKGLLKSDTFTVRGDVSSQFITGLMFILPLLEKDSKIIIETELQSKGYIDLTIQAMREFGVEVVNRNYREFIIRGNQEYKEREYRVEGDYSQGAFFLCADAIGNTVISLDLKENSLQGDKEVIDILERMGVTFKRIKSAIGGKAKVLNGTTIDAKGCPDVIPVLSVVAALSKGVTKIINGERLRIKECDRLKAIYLELTKIGAQIEEKEDGLVIYGVEEFKGGVQVWSHKDHRIAMMLAIASTRCKNPIVLKDYECISKSYPHFFEDFKNLGGKVDEWNMGE
ncbi:3-phosphoshikimate 1-carboxyvinyltransferase [uncultured Clostridium sp.]|uniref:3-phosphoshikimate 1-carboxyvinyltransferase n=1 Tax=uncultured Clostridium sp. TaxID=59620 RepID=UPI00263767F7|nr:3-phosphoshikimate 1-carboxyvinyltransferase [uncultured Clostridium sp.]